MDADATHELVSDLRDIDLGNLGTVDADLELPRRGPHGSVFVWQSSDHACLSDAGRVSRPAAERGDRQVELAVTATLAGASLRRTFLATVRALPEDVPIASVQPTELLRVGGAAPRPPSVAIARRADGSLTTVPVAWRTDAVSMCRHARTTCIRGTVRTHTASGVRELPTVALVHAVDRDPREAEHARARARRLAAVRWRVRLLPGSAFADAQRHVGAYLLSVDDDRMLWAFRAAAGLDTRGAAPLTGWDSPRSKLRGHSTGHYLSALSLAFAATGDRRFRDKARSVVESLADCQRALHEGRGCAEGFLAASDERPFDLLERLTPYPRIWAPYYVLDKVLSGLLDAAELADQPLALQVAAGMGEWIRRRLARLDPALRQRMWATYIAGEFGSLPSALVRLGRLAREPHLYQAAAMLRNDRLLFPMSRGADTLDGLHANQHIPQITGALDLFTYARDTGPDGAPSSPSESLEAARTFWRLVARDHAFRMGGVGQGEMLRAPGREASLLGDDTAETCASYAMLKLTAALFETHPDARYMDYYARVAANHIAATYSGADDGGTTYFLPLGPASRRAFDVGEYTCCHGSGMENPFRTPTPLAIQFGRDLYVNLYIPARATHEDAGGSADLALEALGPGAFRLRVRAENLETVRLRVPDYARGLRIERDGEAVSAPVGSDGYASVPAGQAGGEGLRIRWTPRFQVLRCADDPSLAALRYGPDVLAIMGDAPDWPRLDPRRVEAALRADPQGWERRRSLDLDGARVVALGQLGNEAYHAYVRLPD